MRYRALPWVLSVAGCASCAAPGRDARGRDTLVPVAERATHSTSPAPPPNKPAPAGFTIRAEIRPARGAASVSPPLLALVTPDGRIAGYDTASREHRFQVKGAAEDSSRTADDDEDNDQRAPSGAPARTERPAIIDRRELAVPGQAGGGWTLVVVATEAGRFRLGLQLFAHDVEGGAVHESETTLALARGEVRRFSVGIDAHTFILAPLP